MLVLVRHRDHVTPDAASTLFGNVLETIRHMVQDGFLLMSSIQHKIILRHKATILFEAWKLAETLTVALVACTRFCPADET